MRSQWPSRASALALAFALVSERLIGSLHSGLAWGGLLRSFFAAATFAAPTATPSKRYGASKDQCNTVQPAGSERAAGLLDLVGAAVGNVAAPVGIMCNPVSVIGIGVDSETTVANTILPFFSTAQPFCCTNNSFNGIVVIGCSPINVNL